MDIDGTRGVAELQISTFGTLLGTPSSMETILKMHHFQKLPRLSSQYTVFPSKDITSPLNEYHVS